MMNVKPWLSKVKFPFINLSYTTKYTIYIVDKKILYHRQWISYCYRRRMGRNYQFIFLSFWRYSSS